MFADSDEGSRAKTSAQQKDLPTVSGSARPAPSQRSSADQRPNHADKEKVVTESSGSVAKKSKMFWEEIHASAAVITAHTTDFAGAFLEIYA